MSLSPISKKKLAQVKAGKVQLRGTFRIDVAEIRAKQTAMSKEVADALFGPKKGQKPAKDARRIAKDRAWKQFSLFIRLRDCGPDGYGQCCTCPRRAHYSTMDAGHWITRAKESTLFDERNVSLQCKGCNRFQGGKPLEHEQHIIRKHGSAAPGDLKDKAVKECRRTLFDYQTIEKNYAERVAWIRQHQPGKFRKAA